MTRSSRVGLVLATAQHPSTPHQFRFRAPREAPVGIGALVRVEAGGRTVLGVVTDGVAWTTGPHDPDPAPPDAGEVQVYTVAVLRQEPEEPLQPVPPGEVHAASEAEVATALRMDTYAAATGVPVGLYGPGASGAPVFLDSDFLLGPEAAHCTISGVSGLATKTSAVLFLLQSIFQRFAPGRGTVAAVCFNVKGPDLCFVDQPAALTDADVAIYDRLGLVPGPFTGARFFAPLKPDGVNLNTLRTHADLAATTEPLVWGLREVLDYAEVLLNRDDVDAKAGAFIDFLGERVVGRRFEDPDFRRAFEVASFADLEEFFQAIFEVLERRTGGGSEVWRTHHIATIRKVRNRLANISTRSQGLVTDDGGVSDLPWGEFADRSLLVVDVAGLDPLAQDLVFARVVSKLREHLERRDLGVDHVVVFVDELNKYAPADGPDTFVRRMLLDLSERGRYLGLVLFAAQQFRSQVLRRVVGNAGTSLFGRMDPDELATAGYDTLSPATRAKLAALPKGELMLRHPHFTHPIFVRFPRPGSLTGREGVAAFPPEPDLPFAAAVARQLNAAGARVTTDRIEGLIHGRREADVRVALAAVRRHRPEDPLAFFLGVLGKRIEREVPAPRRGVAPVASREDPYG